MRDKIIIYIGCYAMPPQDGIYACCLDTRTGELTELFSSNAVSNPSYLTLSSDKKRLYSVMEDDFFKGEPGGGIATFDIGDRSLSLINTAGTRGTAPCHILLDEKNHFIFTANYNGGSLSMLALKDNGSAGELSALIQHKADVGFKAVPHPHFLRPTKDSSAIYAVDLGLDVVKYYEIDTDAKTLVAIPSLDIHLPLGSGPRHFVSDVLNPDIIYIICELSCEIIVVNCKHNQIIERISTLEHKSESYCAAIKLSNDGRFLYASNRGDDSIAVFSVGQDSNPLSLIQTIKARGEYPRDIWLCDDWLLCANQKSNTVTMFKRNRESGRLTFLKTALEFPCPVCIID